MYRKLIATFVALIFLSVCALAQQQPRKQQKKKPSVPPAAQWDGVHNVPEKVQPVNGKQGQRLTDFNTSTTNSVGEETPGEQTTNGIAQQWGTHTAVRQPPHNPKPGPGAPPNWEQVGQEPALADHNAAAAYRAEVGGPEGTLGVGGALPASEKAKNKAGNKGTQKTSPPAKQPTSPKQ